MKKMSKFLITSVFVAVMAAPVAAQPMSAPMTATTPSMASAMEAPRPVAMRAAPMPVTARPAAMKAAPVVSMASVAVKAPVAAMAAAPVTMAASVPTAMTAPPATMAASPVAEAPAKAAPATVKEDSKGKVFGGWALELLIYLICTVLLALKGVLIKYLWQKYQLNKYISADKMDEIVDKGVKMGIGYAEEQAHKLHDDPVDGAKKMDLAIGKINEYLRDSGVAEKGAEYLATLVESKLPETRATAQANGAPKPEAAAEEGEKEEEKKDDK